MILVGSMAFAQFPGGPPPGGGRPPQGGPGGRPEGRPDGNMERMMQQNTTIKQKKNVKEGDTFRIIGTLRDSVSKEAMVYTNVALLSAEDSSLVKGGSTDFDGQFEIKDVPAGEYFMRISSVGYQRVFRRIKVENNTALGVILLKPGATTLDAVTITAERPLYALDGEKLIYNVEDDPSVQSGTTSDALQNAPGVEVDIEGNVTLRGVSSVEIWIDDKPSKLTSENLKTYLETLPANTLARIETITNPSAKYATESDAVINIVTSAHIKKNHFISFGANARTQPSVSPWLSYMWANDRLSINIFASGRYDNNLREGWTRTIRRESADGLTFDTVQIDTSATGSVSQRASAHINLNVSYTIDSTSDLDFHLGVFPSWTYGLDTASVFRDQRYLNSTLSYRDSTFQPWNNNLFGFYGATYTKKFDNNGHNLRLWLDGNFDHDGSNSTFTRQHGEQLFDNPLDERRLYNTSNGGFSTSLNGRYNRPYSEKGELSYGFGLRHSYNHYSNMPLWELSDGTQVSDSLRQYTSFDNTTSASADVNWTHRIGNFTLKLGLGGSLRHMTLDYAIDCQSPLYQGLLTDHLDTTYAYLSPSIHLSYRTENLHNYKLNYTLRVSTPSASQLTTRRTYDQDSYSLGNRDLKKAYTHNMEAGWSKYFHSMGNVGIEAYSRISQNEINSLSDNEFDSILNRMVQYSMPHNVGNSYRYGLSTNLMIRPSGFFNVRLYGNLYYAGYTYDYLRDGIQQHAADSKLSWSVRLNSWVKLWNKYQVFASLNYTSPTLSLYSVSKPRYWMNCGVRADFFKRKLSAFVNVQDIFNWGKTIGGGSTNTNPYLLSDSQTYTLNSRYISAGITLRFGKMELERNTTSGSEENGSSSLSE